MKNTAITTRLSVSIACIVMFMVLVSVTATPASASSLRDVFGSKNQSQNKFLSVQQAFNVTADTKSVEDKGIVKVTFDITDGHYVYRDKLKLTLPKGVTASDVSFDKKPRFVDDPSFGKVAVFDQQTVVATVSLVNTTATDITDMPVTLKWQGCAKAGLCYPPEKIKISVTVKKKRYR